MKIPFNKPYITGKEKDNIIEAHERGQLAGDGYFTKLCNKWIENKIGTKKALLTHSCTAALEMTAFLINTKKGDEIIMPSYTFVSTANAFTIRGGTPIFVDIRRDTLNINEKLIEKSITKKTKAIVVVHYAGNPCEMDTIMEIADKYNLIVIEDAAQAIGSYYKGKALGSIGHLACLSFHETKNIISGEGGALLINDISYAQRAEHIREKGTNRTEFYQGKIDKYSWVDLGSSYLPGEIIAAFLWAQLNKEKEITSQRLKIWKNYNSFFKRFAKQKKIITPNIMDKNKSNGHIFYILLRDLSDRNQFISYMKKHEIFCLFHYIPLHSSPFGKKISKKPFSLPITENVYKRLVRLPIWIGIEEFQDTILRKCEEYFVEI